LLPQEFLATGARVEGGVVSCAQGREDDVELVHGFGRRPNVLVAGNT
jgi:hypothetical protein